MIRSPFGARPLLASIAMVMCFLTMAPGAHASTESDAAREQAERILDSREYGQDANRPLADDIDRLGRWLGGKENDPQVPERTDEEIRQETSPDPQTFAPPGLGGIGTFATVMLYVFLGIVIAGIGFLIYKGLRNREKKEKDKEDLEEIDIDWSEEDKVLEYITDAQHLERLSDQAEQAGQLDLALRYRFRAGLLRLNDLEIISFHPSITNAQWQLTINREAFNTLTKDFNDVTYGHKTCDSSVLTRARSTWSALMSSESKAKGR
ncbi:MAG TPA: hypothetical protein PKB15_02690 [Acidimicrobiia bacterium]|nr:hypothetical protein [Acidimicrobiia bacterium]